MEKTVEKLQFGKGWYIMTRENGHAVTREYFKRKGEADTRYKTLRKMGYAEA